MFSVKTAKKDEIVRRLEGDLSNLQETVKSYAEEVRLVIFTPFRRLEHQLCSASFGQEWMIPFSLSRLQVAQLNGKLTATQTTLSTRDQELREKENEVAKHWLHVK